MVYVIVLVWILLFKLGVQFSYMDKRSVNLIPFYNALFTNGRVDVAEIILNVAIFVPLGVYTGVLWRNWAFGKKLAFFFLVSSLFEVVQYALRIGAFDATDIVANTLGGLAGYVMYKVIEKLFNDRGKAQLVINVVATLGTVVMITLLVLLKLNMLPIRYQ